MKPAVSELLKKNGILKVSDLIMPVFVKAGTDKTPLKSLPGQLAFGPSHAAAQAAEYYALGIRSVVLFEITDQKDPVASFAFSERSALPEAISRIREVAPEMMLISDLSLCQYTDHGHCGVTGTDDIDEEKSLGLLERLALKYANAGTDIIMPSAMLDNIVGRIRAVLDANTHGHILIMCQSAKFASAFFNPFRKAAATDPLLKGKDSYQLSVKNRREALREIALDIGEGADIVMIKPALGYLDVISEASTTTGVPVAAFCTSGEHGMLHAETDHGPVFESVAAAVELLTSLKRAGASMIVTYMAAQVAEHLNGRY